MKYLLISLIAFLPVLTSCDNSNDNSADAQLQRQTENLMRESVNITGGLPGIKNFTEKKLVKWILELRDEAKLSTWTYIQDLNGKLHFVGRSIGYGIPASVQYSNPMKIERRGDVHGRDSIIMPQAEANGLFMPDSLSATWIIMIDPKTGQPRPIYMEPLIVVSPFPLPNAEYDHSSYEKESRG